MDNSVRFNIMEKGSMRFFIQVFIACSVVIYAGFGCATGNYSGNNGYKLNKLINHCEQMAGYSLERNYNTTKSYLLLKPFFKKKVGNTRSKVNSFYVIKISDNAIILDEKIVNGTMDWVSDSEISIFYPSGIPGQERTYVYNVHTKSKKSKNY